MVWYVPQGLIFVSFQFSFGSCMHVMFKVVDAPLNSYTFPRIMHARAAQAHQLFCW